MDARDPTPSISPERLPLIELTQKELDLIARSVPGGFHNIQDVYPLTPLQEGILLQHTLRGAGDSYVVLTLLECRSAEAVAALTTAVQSAIDRHDTLRTAFLWQGLGRPVQVVYRSARLLQEELTLDPNRDYREQMKELMRPDLHRLDLNRAPIVRMRVTPEVKPGGSRYVLLALHHLICDGVSMDNLIAELTTHIKSPATQLLAPTQFREYVDRMLKQSGTQSAETYFSRVLGDFHTPSLPFGHEPARDSEESICELERPLPAVIGNRLRTVARKHRVGAAAIFHVACGLVVANTSQLDDVVFGTVFSGRLRCGGSARSTIGMFVNTLPVRLKLAGRTTVDVVSQTHRQLLELMGYEQVELTVPKACSGVAGSIPLFSVLLNYVRRARGDDTGWSDAQTGISMLMNSTYTSYPFTLVVDDLGDEFVLTSQAHSASDSSQMLEYFIRATESLVESLERTLGQEAIALSILSEMERARVIDRFHAEASRKTRPLSEGACDTQSDSPPYEPPEGNTELRLAALWAKILKLDRVGRNQSFFSLGGHSLQGFRLLLEVSDQFHVQAPPIVLFRYPTVRKMAQLIESLTASAAGASDSNPTGLEEGVI